jgi:hypothetical protein
MELSQSTWLITSLSPGGGEKMSKHSVPAGDVAELLTRFSLLQDKAQARTGGRFPIIVIQEAGWMNSGSTECCKQKELKAMLLIQRQLQHHTGSVGQRPTG